MGDYKVPVITGDALSVGDLLRWDGNNWVNYSDSNYSCATSVVLTSLHTYESALSNATSAVKASAVSELASAAKVLSDATSDAYSLASNALSVANAGGITASQLASAISDAKSILSNATSEVKASAASELASTAKVLSDATSAVKASAQIAGDVIYISGQTSAAADVSGKLQLWAKNISGYTELTVSVWDASDESGGAVEQIDDDDTGTHWGPDSKADEWASADMASAKTVARIAVHSKADGANGVRCKNTRLEYSDNNADWNLQEAFQHTNSDGNEFFVVASPSSHRYWRLYVVDTWNSDASWMRVHELVFYESYTTTEFWITPDDGTDYQVQVV